MFPRSSARKRTPVAYQTGSLDDQKAATAGCQKRCCKKKKHWPQQTWACDISSIAIAPVFQILHGTYNVFFKTCKRAMSATSAQIYTCLCSDRDSWATRAFWTIEFKYADPSFKFFAKKKPSSTNHLSENDITPQNQTRKPALKNHPKPFEKRRNLTALDQLFPLDDKVLEFRITGHLARHRSKRQGERHMKLL